MNQQNTFSRVFMLFSLFSVLCHAANVYRADSRSPTAIEAAGGFQAKGLTNIGTVSPDISLWNHVNGAESGASRDDDGYTSTTTSRKLAKSWIKEFLGNNGYVYTIHEAPNMIDCAKTLENYNPYPKEKEMAVLGGIFFDQIVSWVQYTDGKKGKEVKNEKFNSKRFKRSGNGGAQYQLAAFPAGHEAWGKDPWKKYATCTNPKIRAARALVGRSTCKPIKSNVEFAQEYVNGMFD